MPRMAEATWHPSALTLGHQLALSPCPQPRRLGSRGSDPFSIGQIFRGVGCGGKCVQAASAAPHLPPLFSPGKAMTGMLHAAGTSFTVLAVGTAKSQVAGLVRDSSQGEEGREGATARIWGPGPWAGLRGAGPEAERPGPPGCPVRQL